jgi:colanic acid/amylovoran biosynthesis protein
MKTDSYILDMAENAVGGRPSPETDGSIPATHAVSVCLLGLTFDSPNLGVGALLEGSIRGILTCYPEARLSVLDYGYEPFTRSFEFEGKMVPIEFINLRFSKKFYLRNNVAYLLLLSFLLRYLAPARIRKYLIERNTTLRQMSAVDLFASIAGGDSFSDIYGLGRLIYEALPQMLVLMLGKRLVLLPQTLGPFKGRLARWIAKTVMSGAATVCSRDYAGLKDALPFVGEMGADKIRFCWDVGFLLEPRKPANFNRNDLLKKKGQSDWLVGLNISGLLYAGGYNRKNMFGLKSDYKQIVEGLIEFLIEVKGASILLVPHVYPEPAGSNLESDEYACEAVYMEAKSRYPGKVRLVRGRHAPSETKYMIGACDFFVGSRMHSCIAALSQGIPAVAISYSDKFLGVMETLQMSALVADPRQNSIQEILGVVGRAVDQREIWSHHLSDKLPRLREQTLATFKNLVDQ